MTAERRLAKVEAFLSPTELVVQWLEEAHAYGSVEDWTRSQLERPNVVPPLDQLARAAHDGTMTRMKGKPADEVRTAVNTAVRETIFRFELAKRSGLAAVAAADRDNVASTTPRDPTVTAARMARQEADLVEPARVVALEQVGDGHRAFRLATSWVRGKLAAT